MLHITVNGKAYEYPEGIRYLDIAKEMQKQYSSQIVLVFHGQRLRELRNTVTEDGTLRFVTTEETLGMEAYRRSLVLLFLKAFYDVVGREDIDKVTVQFSVSKGYYIEPRGRFTLDEALLSRVSDRMEELVQADTVISKISVSTEDAVTLFHDLGMKDKERLFRFRRASRVNLYDMGGFKDYFYGYMLPSAGYLRYFSLYLYEQGVVLQMPVTVSPAVVPPFEPAGKVFSALLESERWSERLGASTVADLNERIVDGSIRDLILIQEALQEQKLSEIAGTIKEKGNIKFIMIAGPSSSGKTTFSHRLSIQLRAHGLRPHPIEVDNYFLNREDTPRDASGNYNFEDLDSIDVKLFDQNMNDLLAGKRVEMPSFNFKTGHREYKGDYLQLGAEDILVIEGIHCLNEALYRTLPKNHMYKIYISALTQLNVDEHNRVATTDGRLIRRMVRDASHRGITATETISRWNSVRAGEEKNIFPFQNTADIVYNSAQIYELSVLKQYAEPLLFSVPRDAEEYQEAKRLLKFLDYFLNLPSELIPSNSILREFIGGSVFFD